MAVLEKALKRLVGACVALLALMTRWRGERRAYRCHWLTEDHGLRVSELGCYREAPALSSKECYHRNGCFTTDELAVIQRNTE